MTDVRRGACESPSPLLCDMDNVDPQNTLQYSVVELSPKSSLIVKTLMNNEKLSLEERNFLRNELDTISNDPVLSKDAEVMKEVMKLRKKANSPGLNKVCFKPCSQGPFIVVAQKQTSEDSEVKIHPMLLGRLLHKHGVKNIVDIKRNGGNRLAIHFSNFLSANDLLCNNAFESEGFDLFIPKHLVTVQGLVWDVDPSLTIEELLMFIDSPFTITNIRRLSKRVQIDGQYVLKPISGIVITWEGTILPKKIKLNFVQRDVKIYISLLSLYA